MNFADEKNLSAAGSADTYIKAGQETNAVIMNLIEMWRNRKSKGQVDPAEADAAIAELRAQLAAQEAKRKQNNMIIGVAVGGVVVIGLVVVVVMVMRNRAS